MLHRGVAHRTFAFLAVLAVLALGVDSGAQRSAAVYPGAEWERIDKPESTGWSAEGLERVREKLAALTSTGVMAVAGGRVVFEYGDVKVVGQYIMVLPALDLVVAHKTQPGQDRGVSGEQFLEVLDLIVKAHAPR